MPRIDRTFAKMVAIKRLITGTLGVMCGAGILVMIYMLDRPAPQAAYLCVAIFLGGGGWALWDGLKYFREARRAKD